MIVPWVLFNLALLPWAIWVWPWLYAPRPEAEIISLADYRRKRAAPNLTGAKAE